MLLVARGGIGWFTRQVFTRTGLSGLPAHLERRYGVSVSGVTELDTGVYRVARPDGPDWVARVFPAARPVSAADGDARVLQALAQAGFPAERCAADSPVSVLDSQPVLVTEFVTGERPRGNGRTYAILGALLGRLHARPGESLRSLAVSRGRVGQAAEDAQAVAQQAQEITSRARQAFDAD
jgi:Ser/Thr protein kinase RdoA (MazF antagonist)